MESIGNGEIDAFIGTITTKQTPDEAIEKYRNNIALIIENGVFYKDMFPAFKSMICSETPEGLRKKLELFDKDNIYLEERPIMRKLIAHGKYENILLITHLFHGYRPKILKKLESIICWAHPENLKLIIEKGDIIEGGPINIDKLQKLENLMISAHPENLRVTLDAGITHTQSLLDLDYPLSQVTPENFKKIAESFEVAKVFKK